MVVRARRAASKGELAPRLSSHPGSRDPLERLARPRHLLGVARAIHAAKAVEKPRTLTRRKRGCFCVALPRLILNVTRRMRIAIIISLSVFALLGAGLAVHRHIDRTVAQPSRDLSKMMSVRLTTGQALSGYYQQHGRFPGSLSELPLQSLRWGDEGSSARDLDSWRYTSDGQSFIMTWTNASGTDLFLQARSGRVFYSEQELGLAR